MNSSEIPSMAAGIPEAAIQKTVEKHRKVTKAGTSTAWDPSLDLHAFSLEAPSKILQPFTSPIRNMIPRVPMDPKSDVTRWKVVNAIAPSGLVTVSTAAGALGTTITKTTSDKTATIKRIGVSDSVIDDALWFAKSYEDLQATADLVALKVLMEAEDRLDFGGNITALTGAAAPAGTAVVGGGDASILNVAYTLKVTALTAEGYYQSTLAGYSPGVGGDPGESVVVGTSGGVTPAAAGTVNWTWTAINDAVAYNVYIDEAGGGYSYEGTVATNAYSMTSYAGTGNDVPVADTSADANAYDGLVAQLRDAGAPQTSLDGSALTSSGTKNITELLAQFETAYKNHHVGPSDIWCGPEVRQDIDEKIGASTAPAIRVNVDGGDTTFTGGLTVTTLLNPYTNEQVRLHAHPEFPPGLLLALRFASPYDYARLGGSGIDSLVLREYWRETFDRTSYKTTFGVSCMKVLRVRSALGSFCLTNVGN